MEDCTAEALALDRLYNEIDRLYHEFARRCGLSDCAYWLLYALEDAGGVLALRNLRDEWSYSKQTISSALKSLEAKGLVKLGYAEGGRKSKEFSLTEDGRTFCAAHLAPATHAEARAFGTLTADERATLAALTRRYADALAAEIEAALPASPIAGKARPNRDSAHRPESTAL